jgi:hypothetical protein
VAWAVAVRTEIDKRPVTDPVPRDGSVSTGDGQADLVGHGGEYRAVLVCQRPAYRHGSQELGRSDLTPGIFGENLTVYGPEDDRRAPPRPDPRSPQGLPAHRPTTRSSPQMTDARTHNSWVRASAMT